MMDSYLADNGIFKAIFFVQHIYDITNVFDILESTRIIKMV